MHVPPCVFCHCHRTALMCRLFHRKHLHLFIAKHDLSSHCLEKTLLRASHLHNVASRHHFYRNPHHYTSHRLLCVPVASRRSGLSRIMDRRETLALGCRCIPYETLVLEHYCRLCETLALGRCCCLLY